MTPVRVRLRDGRTTYALSLLPKGGVYIVVDDPIDETVMTPEKRAEAMKWYEQTIVPRLKGLKGKP